MFFQDEVESSLALLGVSMKDFDLVTKEKGFLSPKKLFEELNISPKNERLFSANPYNLDKMMIGLADHYAKENSVLTHIIEGDFVNLGGSNNAIGRPETDRLMKATFAIYNKELKNISGGSSIVYASRSSGDEFSLIVMGASTSQIEHSLEKVHEQNEELIEKLQLQNIEHNKPQYKDERRGVGIVDVLREIGTDRDDENSRLFLYETDDLIEKRKASLARNRLENNSATKGARYSNDAHSPNFRENVTNVLDEYEYLDPIVFDHTRFSVKEELNRIQDIRQKNEEIYVLRFDVHNIAGLNKEKGHDGTNQITDDIKENLRSSFEEKGIDTTSFYNVGGGTSYLITRNIPKEKLEIALSQGLESVHEYVANNNLTDVQNYKGKKNGTGVIASIVPIEKGDRPIDILSDLESAVDRGKTLDVAYKYEDGNIVPIGGLPSKDKTLEIPSLSGSETRVILNNPILKILENVVGENKEPLLQMQATLIALYNAGYQGDLRNIYKDNNALSKQLKKYEVDKKSIKEFRDNLEPLGLVAVPKDVPSTGEIAEGMGMVNSAVKNALLIAQAAERTLQVSERMLGKDKTLHKWQDVEHLVHDKISHEKIARSYIVSKTGESSEVVSAQATQHMAEIVEGMYNVSGKDVPLDVIHAVKSIAAIGFASAYKMIDEQEKLSPDVKTFSDGIRDVKDELHRKSHLKEIHTKNKGCMTQLVKILGESISNITKHNNIPEESKSVLGTLVEVRSQQISIELPNANKSLGIG